MHTIEPYYNWRSLYVAAEDNRSPFYGIEYSEFFFDKKIYDHLVHPQWDEFGSNTLYLKVLFACYERNFAIIELLGEWNDLLYNDIMTLKRDFIDLLIDQGIDKFILIGENVLNFHGSDDSYYQEWFEDIPDGWIIGINFSDHVTREFQEFLIDYYILLGGNFNRISWRTVHPNKLFDLLEGQIQKRLSY